MRWIQAVSDAQRMAGKVGPWFAVKNIIGLSPFINRDRPAHHAQDYAQILDELKALPFTLSLKSKSLARLPGIWNALGKTLDAPGPLVEFGVYEGLVSLMLALLVKRLHLQKTVYAFDSWEGLPRPGTFDPPIYHQGDYRSSLDAFLQRIESLDVADVIRVRPGWFQDTVRESSFDDPAASFSFVHLDTDLYESTKVCLEYVRPRMSKGACLRFDEPDKSGVARASTEILGRSREYWLF